MSYKSWILWPVIIYESDVIGIEINLLLDVINWLSVNLRLVYLELLNNLFVMVCSVSSNTK